MKTASILLCAAAIALAQRIAAGDLSTAIPVASNDTFSTNEDTELGGNVLGNDSDVDGPALAVASFTFGGNTFAAGSTAIVGGVGTLSVAPDGSWTFTPAPNFNGPVPPIGITITRASAASYESPPAWLKTTYFPSGEIAG